MAQDEGMYATSRPLRRAVDVVYPAAGRALTIRSDVDWERDIAPAAVSDDGTRFTFHVEATRPFVYLKICLHDPAGVQWSQGANVLVLLTTEAPREVHPYFDAAPQSTFTPVWEIPAPSLGRPLQARAYLPAGYGENPLRRYPVLYMQDGSNLFFPEEAFMNREWQVDESLHLLDEMNAADKCVVVGVHAHDRMAEYTRPGYEAYARAVVDDLRPHVNRELLTLAAPAETGVMGSSLGGVVSFYMAWQHPDVFGFAGCLSSTFSHADDLIERVLTEPFRDLRVYLDSGWPGDNYEVTLAMAMALVARGAVYGKDVLHLSYPLAGHDEEASGEPPARAGAVLHRKAEHGGARTVRVGLAPGRFGRLVDEVGRAPDRPLRPAPLTCSAARRPAATGRRLPRRRPPQSAGAP